MKWGYLFAAVSMLCNVACQQFLGGCFREGGRIFSEAGWLAALKGTLGDFRFWVGGGLAALCLVCWALALSQLPISKALPVMALLFILSPLLATLTLDETVSNWNVVGFVLVALGVALSGIKV